MRIGQRESVNCNVNEWAVNGAPNHKNNVSLAKIASENFNVMIVLQTLRELICEGSTNIMPSGPKPVMDEMECHLSSLVPAWLFLRLMVIL
jgi:hypothetical protein